MFVTLRPGFLLTNFLLSGTMSSIDKRGTHVPCERVNLMEKKQEIELSEGYTSRQAAEIISRNSGRPVDQDLVRKLGQKGIIRTIRVNDRLNLYNKDDVEAWRAEAVGMKAGKAARQRATANWEEGYTSRQAAAIMSRNNQQTVTVDAVRKLGYAGEIHVIQVSSRLNLYNKEDVEKYRIKNRGRAIRGSAASAKVTKKQRGETTKETFA